MDVANESKMVERVANAVDDVLFEAIYSERPFETSPMVIEAQQKEREALAVEVAKAVIAAMREPTEGMKDAGASAAFPGEGISLDDVWHAMIDAALVHTVDNLDDTP